MAVSRLSRQSIQAGFPKQQTVWDQTSQPAAMDAISSITLTADNSSIVFNNIPATYSHLQIRGVVRGATTGWIGYYINNDATAGNYQRHFLYGTGSSAAGGWSGTTSSADGIIAYSASSGAFTGFTCDLLDYTSTNKGKTTRSLFGYDNNGSGTIEYVSSGYYVTNTAVSSITIFSEAGNLNAGTTISLYGVK